MITIYIKPNQFFKNVDEDGNIFEIQNEHLYEEHEFKKVVLDEQYKDCKYQDFNEDLTFSVEKYNARKQKESAEIRIAELKEFLHATDYKALKYAEGVMTAVDYLPIQKQRQEWRNEINDLENLIK